MVIAVCSFAIALIPEERGVGTGVGSAASNTGWARDAEDFLAATLPWESRGDLAPATVRRFGALVAGAAAPIDDVRGTARYRRHALSVLAGRTLTWAWTQ